MPALVASVAILTQRLFSKAAWLEARLVYKH
jgi:hypothetical protein